MADRHFDHCEFGHLLARRDVSHVDCVPFNSYLGHLHESDAIECAHWERLGWPRRDGL